MEEDEVNMRRAHDRVQTILESRKTDTMFFTRSEMMSFLTSEFLKGFEIIEIAVNELQELGEWYDKPVPKDTEQYSGPIQAIENHGGENDE